MGRKGWKETERFERWLRRKHPNEHVGKAGEVCGCPIYNFLKRKISVQYIGPRYIYIKIGNKESSGKLPKWVSTYIWALDKRDWQSMIRACDALKILKQVKEELKI